MSALRPRYRGLLLALGIFVFGVVATAALDVISADLVWTRLFYVPGGPNDGWVYGRQSPWSYLYDYGELPALALLVFAVALYAAAWIGKAPAYHKRACLVIILTVILGPGLLVNGILKPYWGRPRPAEIEAFGGLQKYQKVWEIGVPGHGKSFPCGHCSAAFATASLVSFFPSHPVLSVAALLGGIVYGGVMGIARIAQGAHFPTDVLWSGIIALMLIVLLYYVAFPVRSRDHSDQRE
jgi:membrane-associated PAP2 superfamily phosphatase